MSFLTIITPTYNRAYILTELFDSLRSQTCKDFEWLIVDDGSSDNRKEVVAGFSADFPIRYIWKENGGKHTALNVGIKNITSDLTIIVDSDDHLLLDAVEKIGCYYEKYRQRTEIGALCFLRCHQNGKPIVGLDREEFTDSYIDYRIKGNRPGDMAEVFLTKVLKEYPFPEFPGERFLSEDVVWIEIGKKYRFAFINQPIYVCEYLEDGLTVNDKPAKFKSPMGSMLRGKRLMSRECGWKVNIKGAIIYNCYAGAVQGQIPEILHPESPRDRMLIAAAYLPGIYFRKKWRG